MKRTLGWSILFLLSFAGFKLIEIFFTIEPAVTSGNGNLAIIVIPLFMPLFFISWMMTVLWVKRLFITRQTGTLFFSLTAAGALLFILSIRYGVNLIDALGGGPDQPDSRIYRFGWWNQYTNSLLFNTNTFLLSHVISAAIGGWLARKENNSARKGRLFNV